MAGLEEHGESTPGSVLKSRVNGTIRSNGTSHLQSHSNASSSNASSSASSSSITSSQFASSSTHPILPPHSLLVRQSPNAGRGVFAAEPLSAGTLVEVSHVLLFTAKEYHEHGRHTELDNYTFVWSKGPEGKTMALALGLGSLFNHSHSSPNTNYTLDKTARTIRYTLTRDVLPGEELFISYGVGRMWWEKSADRGDGSASSAEGDEDGEKLENELFMLGQLGIDGEEREARPLRRREERRKQATLSNDDSPQPPSTPATMSLAPSPPIPPPKSVGPSAAPLWRITAAVDPTTTPLELMAVWAVDIDPRKSANFIQFSRSIARRLRAAEEGGDGQEHIRRGERQNNQLDEDEDDEGDDDDDDSEDEDESMKHLRIFHRMGQDNCLTALVCRVQDVPSLDKVTSLLEKADVVLNGSKPKPFQVQAPKYPAPSRLRLPEWKAYWPVAVKHGRMLDASSKSSLLGISANVAGGNCSPGIVDRGADARLWTKEATQWAVTHFIRCLALAKEAKERGELPVGVHVTPSYSDSDASTLGPDGHPWIQVDAWDTRQSERNPIKHGVTNAIRDVAKLRSDRDKERLQLLAVKAATTPSGREQRSKTPIDDAAAAACRNGQDYLLNGLTLFTTHEPCVSCCMALVHSRVRSIFFIKPSPGAGGCCGSGLSEGRRCSYAEDGGPYAIQEQDGLNHHFDVWKWVGDPKLLTGDEGSSLDELLDIHNLDA